MYANSPSHIDTICVHNHSFICNNRMIIHSISSINKYKYSCICNMKCDRVELVSNVYSRIHEQPLATISIITCFKYMFTSIIKFEILKKKNLIFQIRFLMLQKGIKRKNSHPSFFFSNRTWIFI